VPRQLIQFWMLLEELNFTFLFHWETKVIWRSTANLMLTLILDGQQKYYLLLTTFIHLPILYWNYFFLTSIQCSSVDGFWPNSYSFWSERCWLAVRCKVTGSSQFLLRLLLLFETPLDTQKYIYIYLMLQP
jgi:hypothetical protein